MALASSSHQVEEDLELYVFSKMLYFRHTITPPLVSDSGTVTAAVLCHCDYRSYGRAKRPISGGADTSQGLPVPD